MVEGKDKRESTNLAGQVPTSDWNAVSEAYSELPFSTEWHVGYPTVIDALGPLVGLRVVDYGCGDGKFSRVLAKLGATVLGVDISSEMIKLAEAHRGVNIQFRLIDSDDLGDIPSGSFDAATLCWVLCAIQHESDLQVVAHRLSRLLKPGGKVVIIENNPEAFGNRFSSFSVDRQASFSLGSPSIVAVRLYGVDKQEVRIQDAYWPDDVIRSLFTKTSGFQEIAREASPPETSLSPNRSVGKKSLRPFRILVFQKG